MLECIVGVNLPYLLLVPAFPGNRYKNFLNNTSYFHCKPQVTPLADVLVVESECLNEWFSKWKPIHHKIWKICIKSNIKQCYDIPFLMTEKIPAYNFTQELVFHEWAAGLRERNYIILVLFCSVVHAGNFAQNHKNNKTHSNYHSSIVLCGVVFTATLWTL